MIGATRTIHHLRLTGRKSPGLLTLLLLGHRAEDTPEARHMLLDLLSSKEGKKEKAKFFGRRVSSLLMPLSRCRKNSARVFGVGRGNF